MSVEEEKKLILSNYRKLLKDAQPFLKDGDAKLIKKAFNVSLKAHDGMRRKSGEPYIIHPIQVAQIAVEEIGLGTTSIVSALLHDVVEDTEWEVEDIEREFGPKVAKIIDGLTKIKGVFEFGTTDQAENFRKMILTLSDDVRVILIKLADRLHNMRTMESMPRHKQLRTASETIYLYAPLAHRLGLYEIKTELEDLHLKYSDKDYYESISSQLAKTKEVRDRFISIFSQPIIKNLKSLGVKFEVKARTKSINSIATKMKKQEIPFDKVYDLFAIRIILDVPLEEEKALCWRTYSIVTDHYLPNPNRLRDWVSTAKANGYESLHTTVMSKAGQWVEVQIRTKRMDDIAERGFAAHWKYKSDGEASNNDRIQDWLDEVRKSLDNKDLSALDFVDEFRNNFFDDEVFVFTRNGELKVFPYGASSLDFAFSIHTQLGLKCLGAKINNKLEPLSYVLKSGDQIEIITSSKTKPTSDWLRYVKTTKAKHKINDALKESQKTVAKEGKEILLRKFKQMKLDYNEKNLIPLFKQFNLTSSFELLYKVGSGEIDSTKIKDAFKVKSASKTSELGTISDAKTFKKEVQKIRKSDSDMLLIGEDMDHIDYNFAQCCNPIDGDDVFGFVTSGEGIKIHRTNCPNAIELMSNYGYRIVKAKWIKQHKLAFLVGLQLKGIDRVGLIKDITNIISSNHKVNMRSISFDVIDGMFYGSILLFINDTKHLDMLITTMENVEGMTEVERFDHD